MKIRLTITHGDAEPVVNTHDKFGVFKIATAQHPAPPRVPSMITWFGKQDLMVYDHAPGGTSVNGARIFWLHRNLKHGDIIASDGIQVLLEIVGDAD
jgi:hypothetical protein